MLKVFIDKSWQVTRYEETEEKVMYIEWELTDHPTICSKTWELVPYIKSEQFLEELKTINGKDTYTHADILFLKSTKQSIEESKIPNLELYKLKEEWIIKYGYVDWQMVTSLDAKYESKIALFDTPQEAEKTYTEQRISELTAVKKPTDAEKQELEQLQSLLK